MPKSKSESGQQSPPPSYFAANTPEPLSSHLKYDEACIQCEHSALGMDKLGIENRQSAHSNEKVTCQCEHHTKGTETLDFQNPKWDIDTEDGKWETKKGGIKRKWATKKEDMRRKWEKVKDDMRLKWATKTGGAEVHPYVPLNENEKVAGNGSGPNVPLGENVKSRKKKKYSRAAYSRAALAGDDDAMLMATVASFALFAVCVF